MIGFLLLLSGGIDNMKEKNLETSESNEFKILTQ